MTNRGKAIAWSLSFLAILSTLGACKKSDYSYPKTKWTDGQIVTVGGKTYDFAAIYKLAENTKDSKKATFDAASKALAEIVTPVTDSIKANVDRKISTQETTWRSNASSNNTSYKEEMEKTLDSEGVLTEDELREKYISDAQVEQNQKDYAKVVTVKDGEGETEGNYEYYISEQDTKDFVNEKAPYHVSHILIKVDASGASGTGIWSGEISSSDADQITDVVKSLSSSESFGDVALQMSEDTSSATRYGELASDDSVAMTKDTSYVNEFKLGLYAYDTFINPKTKGFTRTSGESTVTIKNDLRVPSADSTDGGITTSPVSSKIAQTEIAKGNVYGIPLSVCYLMRAIDDIEKDAKGNPVKTPTTQTNASAALYPRNVYFNNYFNQHGVSFIYDDSADFDQEFVDSINSAYGLNLTVAKLSEWLKDTSSNKELKAQLKKQYEYVKQQFDLYDPSKFSEVPSISEHLIALGTTAAQNDGTKFVRSNEDFVSVGSGKNYKILCADSNDPNHPIIVTRAGSGSGDSGYQGIHFIVVNHDRFGNVPSEKNQYAEKDTDYRYWRLNKPDTETGATPNTADYSANPSFVNFVKADINAVASANEYTTRSGSVSKALSNWDSANADYKRYEANKATFKARFSRDFDSVLGDSFASVVNNYISTNEKATKVSEEKSLDDSWESYVNSTLIYQDMQPSRVIPTVVAALFQNGDLNTAEDILNGND